MKRRRKTSRRHKVSHRKHAYNGHRRHKAKRTRRNKGKVSAYARFVGAKMRAGHSMKAAARMWKSK